jgi:hypothetical protein
MRAMWPDLWSHVRVLNRTLRELCGEFVECFSIGSGRLIRTVSKTDVIITARGTAEVRER